MTSKPTSQPGSPGGAMTPTDPELVTRLRAFIDWRNSHAAEPYQDLLTESLAALDAAEARVQQLEAALINVRVIAAKVEDDEEWVTAQRGNDMVELIDEVVGRADTQEPAHED